MYSRFVLTKNLLTGLMLLLSLIGFAACATSPIYLEGPAVETPLAAGRSDELSSERPFEARRKGLHPVLDKPAPPHPGAPDASAKLLDDLASSPSAATAALWWSLYKQTYSRIDGPTCEFSPSCSRFGVEAVSGHGPLGFSLTFGRLLRHHDHDFYPKIGNLLADPVANYTGWGPPYRLDEIHEQGDPARGWHGHLRATRRLHWPAQDTRDLLKASTEARVEPLQSEVDDEHDIAEQSKAHAPDFESYLRWQAAMEARLGTALFRQGDDYRAITALKRYQLLDGSDEAHFMSHLMIGEIYRRNQYPTLALRQFEQAIVYAPEPKQAAYGYLMAIQELCIPMSLYAECYLRLLELEAGELDAAQRELVGYQKLYSELVLRAPNLSPARAEHFTDPLLRAHALDLIEHDEAFRALPMKQPWLAGMLSGVLPGAGQAYNGRWIDGTIALGFNALFGAATYYSAVHLESLPLAIAAGTLSLGFYTGNIVNAVVDSRRINAERIRGFFDDLAIDHWPRLSFAIDENTVHFGFTFDWPGDGSRPRDIDSLPDQGPGTRTSLPDML